MSIPTVSQTHTYPSEKVIIEYGKKHPVTVTGMIKLYVPNVLESVAKYFANKEIRRDELSNHVKIAVRNAIQEYGTEDQNLGLKIQTQAEEITDSNLMDLKEQLLSSFEPRATYAICEKLMNDLVGNVTYTAPTSEQGEWTRNVTNLT